MFDKRVHRGNSYAAMVIPAGTNHDTMVMEKRQTQKAQSLKSRRSFKAGKIKVSLNAFFQLTAINNFLLSNRPKELFQSIQTEIFHLQSQFQEESTVPSRLISIGSTWLISHQLRRLESPLSSISTDHPYQSLNQRCQQRKIAKPLKFLTEIGNSSTSIRKLNLCWMLCV